jgi:hypothetical protein
VEKFILELVNTWQECLKEMKKNVKMSLTEEEEHIYKYSKCCHICKKPFLFSKDAPMSEYKVRDHCHRTGKFRGAAHNKCNINYFSNRFLPIIAHNLRGYDSHLIIRKAYEIMSLIGDKKINVIPNSCEKFMSFSIGELKFIDSFQFMGESLEQLAKNLYDPHDKHKNFTFMKQIFPEHYQLLCQKGHYPYEWVDSIEKLKHPGLPPREAFRNALRQEDLTDAQWDHIQNVYRTLN